jgi:hypothetical protein
MAAKLTRLTHAVAIELHLVAESCTIFSSRARRPVRKLLDTPSYYLLPPEDGGNKETLVTYRATARRHNTENHELNLHSRGNFKSWIIERGQPHRRTDTLYFLSWLTARVYPKVSGLAAWSENCKWYSSLPLDAVVSLFCVSDYWVLPP